MSTERLGLQRTYQRAGSSGPSLICAVSNHTSLLLSGSFIFRGEKAFDTVKVRLSSNPFYNLNICQNSFLKCPYLFISWQINKNFIFPFKETLNSTSINSVPSFIILFILLLYYITFYKTTSNVSSLNNVSSFRLRCVIYNFFSVSI